MKKFKPIKTPENILARLANMIYIELKLDPSRLKTLIYRFVKGIQTNTENKLYYTKINLFNELTKDTMTFKVFIKLLHVLNIKKVMFSVKITTSSDYEVTVHEEVYLSNIGGDNESQKDI